MAASHELLLYQFIVYMQIAKRSPVTIESRIELLNRLVRHIEPVPLLDATLDDLIGFQATFAHLAPASVDIYSRHVLSFYQWALKTGRLQIDVSRGMPVPHVARGIPHPTTLYDAQIIFACTVGPLRTAYILAALAGARGGEITRLRGEHLDLDSPAPSALINGKGGRQRIIPLLPPVVSELRNCPRRGWIVTRDGHPYTPNYLSVDSHRHLKEIGVETTLHSLRHFFATNAVRLTKDLLLVRDILGHASVATTQIYTASDTSNAQATLQGFSELGQSLLRPSLRLVVP